MTKRSLEHHVQPILCEGCHLTHKLKSLSWPSSCILHFLVFYIYFVLYIHLNRRDRMVVGFTTNYAISAYHH